MCRKKKKRNQPNMWCARMRSKPHFEMALKHKRQLFRSILMGLRSSSELLESLLYRNHKYKSYACE